MDINSCIGCKYNNFITNTNCFKCIDKSRFKPKEKIDIEKDYYKGGILSPYWKALKKDLRG